MKGIYKALLSIELITGPFLLLVFFVRYGLLNTTYGFALKTLAPGFALLYVVIFIYYQYNKKRAGIIDKESEEYKDVETFEEFVKVSARFFYEMPIKIIVTIGGIAFILIQFGVKQHWAVSGGFVIWIFYLSSEHVLAENSLLKIIFRKLSYLVTPKKVT